MHNYCSFIGGNLVAWRSKKQNVVARSSAEAEFRAVAHGVCEVLWIKRILEELKIPNPLPMKVYCDNKAAISIAHNLEVDKHFVKEKIEWTNLYALYFYWWANCKHTYKRSPKETIWNFNWQANYGRYLQASLRASIGKCFKLNTITILGICLLMYIILGDLFIPRNQVIVPRNQDIVIPFLIFLTLYIL